MTPGEAIRRTRLRKGLSQRTLARRAGTSQAAISKIERGLEAVTWERLESILLAMGEEPVLDSKPIPHELDPGDLLRDRRKPPARRLREGFAWDRFASRVGIAGRRARERAGQH